MNRRLLGPAALAALLVLGACGSDNKVADVKPATTSPKAASDSTAAGTPGSAKDTSDSGSATTADPKFTGSGSGDFCSFARQVEKDQSKLGDIGSGTQSDQKKAFSDLDSLMKTAVNKAPSEIKNDFKTMQAGFSKLEDIYKKYDFDNTKMGAEIAKDPTGFADSMKAMSDPAFLAASERIGAYMTKVCGIKDSTDTTVG